jgi:hypothetical protein
VLCEGLDCVESEPVHGAREGDDDVYAHVFNDHADAMAVLGAMGQATPTYGGNVVSLHG